MRKKKHDLDLQKYTKDDLIWVIERLYSLGDEFSVRMRLNELDHKKTKDRLNKCDALCREAAECRSKYIDLIEPYQGKPIKDIPLDVLKEAEQLIERGRKLDKEWTRLIKLC